MTKMSDTKSLSLSQTYLTHAETRHNGVQHSERSRRICWQQNPVSSQESWHNPSMMDLNKPLRLSLVSEACHYTVFIIKRKTSIRTICLEPPGLLKHTHRIAQHVSRSNKTEAWHLIKLVIQIPWSGDPRSHRLCLQFPLTPVLHPAVV